MLRFFECISFFFPFKFLDFLGLELLALPRFSWNCFAETGKAHAAPRHFGSPKAPPHRATRKGKIFGTLLFPPVSKRKSVALFSCSTSSCCPIKTPVRSYCPLNGAVQSRLLLRSQTIRFHSHHIYSLPCGF